MVSHKYDISMCFFICFLNIDFCAHLCPFVIGIGKEFYIFIDPFSLVRFRKLVFGLASENWSSVLTDYIYMMVFCIVKPSTLKTEVQLSLCPHLVTILDRYRIDIGEPGVRPCSEPAGVCLYLFNAILFGSSPAVTKQHCFILF